MTLRTKWLTAVTVAVLALLGAVAAPNVYAYATYHGTWGEQPTFGNHWWFNFDTELQWHADDYWTPGQLQNLKNGHNTFPWHEYRLEREAYNPGGGSSCDRLVYWYAETVNLPVQAWTVGNGCGSSSFYEELKIDIDENAITAETWLRHWVRYAKQGSGSGEVNYSFSHNHTWSDSWMGKITYDGNFNRTGSDPSGLVN